MELIAGAECVYAGALNGHKQNVAAEGEEPSRESAPNTNVSTPWVTFPLFVTEGSAVTGCHYATAGID
jgi:hypothetical protein